MALALDLAFVLIAIRVLITRSGATALVLCAAVYALMLTGVLVYQVPVTIDRVNDLVEKMQGPPAPEAGAAMKSLKPLLIGVSLMPTVLRIISSGIIGALTFRSLRRRETFALSSAPETTPAEAGTPSRRT